MFFLQVRLNQMKGWFPRAHWEPRFGTPIEARDYCKKEGKWRDRGDMNPGAGASQKFGTEAYWANIIEMIRAKSTWPEVILDPGLAGCVSRCMAWARHVFDSRPYRFRPLDIRADGYRYQARFDLFLRMIEPEDASGQ